MTGPRPYGDYKSSRIDGVARIPSHWREARGRQFFREVDTRSLAGTEEPLSVSHLTGVRPRGTKNVTMVAESHEGHKICDAGDIVVNTMWAWMGAAGVARQQGIVSPSYSVYRQIRENFDHNFLDYLLRTPEYIDAYTRRSTGIHASRLRLYPQKFLDLRFPCPPSEDQRAIVRFLDHRNSLIRRYIGAKKTLIALLDEQKRTIVHRVVTHGLDPAVRLKSSGVEWLGDVPEHWVVSTLGRIAASFRTGPFGSALHQSDYTEGGVPLVNPTHMVRGRILEDMRSAVSEEVLGRLAQYVLAENDVVFSRRGDLGRCALVTSRETGWLLGTGSIRVRLNTAEIEPAFAIEMLQASWVRDFLSLSSVGSTMQNLNTDILRRVPVLLPPLGEQRQILNRLSVATERLDRGLNLAYAQIRNMLEFRATLVAAVVIGELDVREAAAHLPDEIEDTAHLAEPLDDGGDGDPETPEEEEALA